MSGGALCCFKTPVVVMDLKKSLLCKTKGFMKVLVRDRWCTEGVKISPWLESEASSGFSRVPAVLVPKLSSDPSETLSGLISEGSKKFRVHQAQSLLQKHKIAQSILSSFYLKYLVRQNQLTSNLSVKTWFKTVNLVFHVEWFDLQHYTLRVVSN